jgi:hypothetical protein
MFTLESKSKSVVQFDPVPENFEYFVVSNLKTADGYGHSLKSNEDEKLLLANTGEEILVQRISASKGLDEKRKMDIPAWKPKTNRVDGKSVPIPG